MLSTTNSFENYHGHLNEDASRKNPELFIICIIKVLYAKNKIIIIKIVKK